MISQEIDPDLPVGVQQCPVEAWVGGGLLQAGGTECSSACGGPFDGGHHYLLSSGQTTGREHSPAQQQKIGFKIY